MAALDYWACTHKSTTLIYITADDLGSRRLTTGTADCCARRERAGRIRPQSSASQSTMPRFPSLFLFLRYIGPASAHRAQSSNAALPSVGEVTFVGSTITLPRLHAWMAVQPEKVNQVDAEASSS
jgi:hypothetical protein